MIADIMLKREPISQMAGPILRYGRAFCAEE